MFPYPQKGSYWHIETLIVTQHPIWGIILLVYTSCSTVAQKPFPHEYHVLFLRPILSWHVKKASAGGVCRVGMVKTGEIAFPVAVYKKQRINLLNWYGQVCLPSSGFKSKILRSILFFLPAEYLPGLRGPCLYQSLKCRDITRSIPSGSTQNIDCE